MANTAGYCYIDIFERDKLREEDSNDNDDGPDDGPYGGAFASYDDFHRWKEGPGFFSD